MRFQRDRLVDIADDDDDHDDDDDDDDAVFRTRLKCVPMGCTRNSSRAHRSQRLARPTSARVYTIIGNISNSNRMGLSMGGCRYPRLAASLDLDLDLDLDQ